MILNNAVNAGNFIYCMAHISPNETYTYINDGHGHYHQFAYIIEGYGVAEIRNTPDGEIVEFNDTKPVPGTLLDLSHSKGQYHTTKTFENGLTFIFFNPIPDTRILDVEILKGETTRTVTAGENRIIVVCITGPITANGKTLESLQHAKIFPGKTAELTLPSGSICALVTE